MSFGFLFFQTINPTPMFSTKRSRSLRALGNVGTSRALTIALSCTASADSDFSFSIIFQGGSVWESVVVGSLAGGVAEGLARVLEPVARRCSLLDLEVIVLLVDPL